MTYNVFGGTLNPTLPTSTDYNKYTRSKNYLYNRYRHTVDKITLLDASLAIRLVHRSV